MKKISSILIAIVLTLGLFSCSTEQSETTKKLSIEDKQQLAEDAYLYGLQQTVFYEARFNYAQNEGSDAFAGVNRWSLVNDGEPIDTKFKAIVTVNATTAYAMGFCDTKKEPLVFDMPEVIDRYFSLQLMDHYGIFWLYAGNQFNGTKANSYLILPEGYKGSIPASFATTEVITLPSTSFIGVVRYARKDPSSKTEIKLLNDILAETTITPLSKWIANGNKGVKRSDKAIELGDYKQFPRMKEITSRQVDKQNAEDFFTFLNLDLNDPTTALVKDSKEEFEMLARLSEIGIGKGLSFDWSQQDEQTKEALSKGFESGRMLVKTSGKENLLNMNGWGVISNNGGYATNWLDRSIMGDFGWLGPDRSISHGAAFAFTDSEGEKLNGKNNYTITFDMNNLPPVTQFWSIPMYDVAGYFVKNEIKRFSVNQFGLDAGKYYVADGKLTFYLQHKKPTDKNKAKNWLPTPADGFRMTPRFYGPKYPLIDGSYNMPKVIMVK